MREEDTSRAQHSEKVALFRYGLISDLLHPTTDDDGSKTLHQRLREKSLRSYCIPGSRRTKGAVETMRDWLALYKAGGFDALKPNPARTLAAGGGFPRR